MSWFPAPEHLSSTLKPTLRTASSSMSRVSRESKKPTPLVPTNSRPARSGVTSDPTLWPRTPTRRRLPRGGSLEPNSLCKKQDQKYYVWVSFSYSFSKFCFEVRQLAHCNVYEPSEIVVRNRTRFLKISTSYYSDRVSIDFQNIHTSLSLFYLFSTKQDCFPFTHFLTVIPGVERDTVGEKHIRYCRYPAFNTSKNL